MGRLPTVNTNEDNYYSRVGGYYYEEQIAKEDAERTKKYCRFHNVLMVYSPKKEAFICPQCGFNPSENLVIDSKQVTEPHEVSEYGYLETSRHYRTDPNSKTPNPVYNYDADETMRIIPIEDTKGTSGRSRVDQSKHRYDSQDSDLIRLKGQGLTIIRTEEQADSTGTFNRDDLIRGKRERSKL
jgi:hypothetical protein